MLPVDLQRWVLRITIGFSNLKIVGDLEEQSEQGGDKGPLGCPVEWGRGAHWRRWVWLSRKWCCQGWTGLKEGFLDDNELKEGRDAGAIFLSLGSSQGPGKLKRLSQECGLTYRKFSGDCESLDAHHRRRTLPPQRRKIRGGFMNPKRELPWWKRITQIKLKQTFCQPRTLRGDCR